MKKTLLSITLATFVTTLNVHAASPEKTEAVSLGSSSSMPNVSNTSSNASNTSNAIYVAGELQGNKRFSIKRTLEKYFKDVEAFVSDDAGNGLNKDISQFPTLPELTDEQKKLFTQKEIAEYQEYIDGGLLLRESVLYAQVSEKFFSHKADILKNAKTVSELEMNLDEAPAFPDAPESLSAKVKNDWTSFKGNADTQRQNLIEALKTQIEHVKEQLNKTTEQPSVGVSSESPVQEGKTVEPKSEEKNKVEEKLHDNAPNEEGKTSKVNDDDYFANNNFFKRDKNGNLMFTPTSDVTELPDFSKLMEADCKLLDDDGNLQVIKH